MPFTLVDFLSRAAISEKMSSQTATLNHGSAQDALSGG